MNCENSRDVLDMPMEIITTFPDVEALPSSFTGRTVAANATPAFSWVDGREFFPFG
jgi:hypothetical protein